MQTSAKNLIPYNLHANLIYRRDNKKTTQRIRNYICKLCVKGVKYSQEKTCVKSHKEKEKLY